MNKRSGRRSIGRGGGSPPSPSADPRGSETSHVDSHVGRQIERKLDDNLAPVLNDPDKRGKVVKRVVAVMEQEEYRGPLPHPDHFADYEAASPGAGSKIIKMVDSSRARADDRYDAIVKNDHQYRVLGMVLAAVILVTCLIAGTVLCIYDKPGIGGSLLAASAMTAIASRFIDGKKQD